MQWKLSGDVGEPIHWRILCADDSHFYLSSLTVQNKLQLGGSSLAELVWPLSGSYSLLAPNTGEIRAVLMVSRNVIWGDLLYWWLILEPLSVCKRWNHLYMGRNLSHTSFASTRGSLVWECRLYSILCHLLPVWSWPNHFTSLCLPFIIHKMGTRTLTWFTGGCELTHSYL